MRLLKNWIQREYSNNIYSFFAFRIFSSAEASCFRSRSASAQMKSDIIPCGFVSKLLENRSLLDNYCPSNER